ncbi:hypothetical protein NUU61_009354 [Penicillium alfredii]|uniref:Uncharacterized protein n=1 Tax=Penicillium alfredii TaxID=1506179 RepID=A0A9W9EN40_9EURO|nr:uncharacterized protein NUU61_009354 [Penicillium alfredii]KAJ5084775.1 hypothetical protein NUU61_009354 [Penicillium alfredii]
MDPIKLPPAAEDVRKEIKGIIPETSTSSHQAAEIEPKIRKDGNKTYLGDWLANKISFLKKEMHIGDAIGDGWGWHLVYFSNSTELQNDRKQGFLVPLSEEITLTPGGVLQEGFYMNITTEPVVSSGATAIFIVPRN